MSPFDLVRCSECNRHVRRLDASNRGRGRLVCLDWCAKASNKKEKIRAAAELRGYYPYEVDESDDPISGVTVDHVLGDGADDRLRFPLRDIRGWVARLRREGWPGIGNRSMYQLLSGKTNTSKERYIRHGVPFMVRMRYPDGVIREVDITRPDGDDAPCRVDFAPRQLSLMVG